jgi:hypothetical protein
MGRSYGINRIEVRCTQGFFLGKPEGKRPLGIPRHGWEDNFKMGLPEIGRFAANYFCTGRICLMIHTSGGFLSARCDRSGFIECGKCLD